MQTLADVAFSGALAWRHKVYPYSAGINLQKRSGKLLQNACSGGFHW